jgi:hypothetical protein
MQSEMIPPRLELNVVVHSTVRTRGGKVLFRQFSVSGSAARGVIG